MSAEEPEPNQTAAASEDANVTPAVDNEALAMEISQYVAERISTMMEKKFGDLSATLENIATRLESNTKRITEAESRVSDVEDNMSAMESRLKGLETKVRALTDRSIDIEGRSRRDNILIFNLKENAEGRQPVTFFEKWLPTLLNLETKRGIIKIDRAHRSLGPPKPNRPRAVIIKLHNPRDKMRILAAAREKGPLTHEGQTRSRQDLASGVKEMRRAFNGVCQRLIDMNIRFSMRFPATLSFSHRGKSHSFHSPKDALAYVDGLS
ncbi:unnamed protein product [Scomber scombrus]|uniref:Unnamed protein product n=1 Tax=Scomber scombrus TaxID=13677 RepID=A0AAV1NFD2_SCOSC